jgi:hypothetical protein
MMMNGSCWCELVDKPYDCNDDNYVPGHCKMFTPEKTHTPDIIHSSKQVSQPKPVKAALPKKTTASKPVKPQSMMF